MDVAINTKLRNNRDIGIDALRLLLSFCVVCIHVPIPSSIGLYIKVISRVAVPCFFMISGYYYNKTKENRTTKQIKNLLKLGIASESFYFVFGLAIQVISSNGAPLSYIIKNISFGNTAKFLIFNETFFGAHSWYLFAAVYVLAVSLLTDKFITVHLKNENVIYVVALILLLVNLIMGEWSELIFGLSISEYITRNWLFTGLPFFTLGRFIRKTKLERHKLYQGLKGDKENYNQHIRATRMLGGGIAMTLLALTCIENYLLRFLNHYNENTCIYFFAIFAVIVIFVLSLNISELGLNGKLPRLFANIGRKYSLYIYIFHNFILTIITILLKKSLINNEVIITLFPVAVYFASLLFAVFFDRLIRLIKNISQVVLK